MDLGKARLQKSSEQLELPFEDAGEARGVDGSGEAVRARRGDERSVTGHLMEEVVERTNLKAALKRVKQNKGGPGIDAMTVTVTGDILSATTLEITGGAATGGAGGTGGVGTGGGGLEVASSEARIREIGGRTVRFVFTSPS